MPRPGEPVARRLLSPAFLLTELCKAAAIVALADLAVRSAILLDPYGYDSFFYHLPFAAARAGVPLPYDMNDTMRARFDAFPPLPELVQGLLWRITGSVNATGVVNFIAFGAFLVYAQKVFRAPIWLVSLISLTAPLVLIHTTVDYVDLFGNAWLAIGVTSILFAYLFPERRSRAVVIGGLAGLALAAWTKYTLVPVVIVAFIGLAVMVIRSPTAFRFSRRQAAGVILVFAVLASAPYVKNLAVYGNPFWPFRVPFVGSLFPYTFDPTVAREDHPIDRPPQLKDAPQLEVFVESLFETRNPLRYEDRPRWILDQFQWSPANAHRMGGFWGIGTAIFLVLSAGMMIAYRRRAGIIASLAGVALLLFVGVLPQSNELRYFMFIPLTWAATIGMLFKPIQTRFPRVATGILALVLVLFGYIVTENWLYYQPVPIGIPAVAKIWGADEFWPLLDPDQTYCAVYMYPLGFLLTGPTLSEFSIVDRSEASLCPPGTIIITREGIQGPAG
jgi:MFS family permease